MMSKIKLKQVRLSMRCFAKCLEIKSKCRAGCRRILPDGFIFINGILHTIEFDIKCVHYVNSSFTSRRAET
jgi:hypothetical protein